MVCGEYGCPSFAQLLRFLHTLYTVHQCFPLETLPRLDYLGRHLARLFKPRMGGGRSRSQDDIRSGAGSPERCHRLRGSHLCEPGGHLKGSGAIHPKSVRVLCAFLCGPTRWRLIATHLPRPHGNSAHRASRSRLGLMTALAAGNGGRRSRRPGPRSALVALRWVVQPRLRVRPASGWLAGRTSFLRGDSDKLPEARCS